MEITQKIRLRNAVLRLIISFFCLFLFLITFTSFVFPQVARGVGGPVTKQDIEDKCLDGSYSKILSDVIQVGLDGLFNVLGFGFGSDVPTENEKVSFQTIGGQVEACTRDLIEKSSKIMLQNLQKKLMDQLVKQTIGWINDDQEPKYVTNFWDFTKDALDVAAGDTIRELDLAKLYPDENLKKYLISVVEERARGRTTRFSENISYDLDKQVDDVEAFKEDFTKGGYAGLITATDFKNNPAGAAFAAGLYLNAKESQELSNQSGRVNSDGFKSDVVCTTWVLVKKSNSDSGVGGAYINPTTGKEKVLTYLPEDARKLSDPPPDENINGIDYTYICPDNYEQSGIIVKTPSGIVGSVAQKAVLQQFDYVLSAKDINSYISQIADGAINRLMREGIAFFGSTDGENSEYLPQNIGEELNQYNQNYTGEGVQNQSKLLTRDNLIPRAEKLIVDSSSTLGTASAQNSILWFEARINFMERSVLSTSSPIGLVECMNIKPGFMPNNYPIGCIIPQNFPPQAGNCKILFTGKTPGVLKVEFRALVNTTRAANNARKNEAQTVFDNMTLKLPFIRAIKEETPLSEVNQLKIDVGNAEKTLKKTRDDFSAFRDEINPQINHLNAERIRAACDSGSY